MKTLAVLMSLMLLLAHVPALAAGQIHLYGERHGDAQMLAKELSLWEEAYKAGQRHLFVELPYYTAQYLNQWMQAENDDILDAIYCDWRGSASHAPQVKGFYQAIKARCPETVFHGTDVGHQYQTTGARYLAELEQQNLTDSPAYRQAQSCIQQGQAYYETGDALYREKALVANFIAAYDALGDAAIMGIYGSAHTEPTAAGSMAAQLQAHYGDALQCTDLTAQPLYTRRVDFMGASYTASYFGKQDLSAYFPQYSHREFWRLEGAYEACAGLSLNGNVLPYHNYPMPVAPGQVFLVVMTLQNGSQVSEYYRSDGNTWQDQPVTEQFLLP
ncbi:MAG: hypothetical protein IJ461_04040 [Clostridia bacterium]|nr:hypothetical protein [Clostridia bacterium]